MTFLPEHDRDFFEAKQIRFEEVIETQASGVVFPDFQIPDGLFMRADAGLVPCSVTDLLVVVPQGYNDTKLDSFYVHPWLFHSDGREPQNCTGRYDFSGRTWQFWSRHQPNGSWRAGIDAFDTFIPLIREALRAK